MLPPPSVFISFCQVLLVAVSLAYIGLGLMAYLVTPRLLYPIPTPTYELGSATATLQVPGIGQIVTTSLDSPGAGQMVLYHHGNAEDLGNLQPRLSGFQKHGYAAFAYDYPGYGHSAGHPSEASLLAAAEAAFEHLTTELGWAPENIIHYGHSLGGGPAIAMGARHPSRAVVVEGTFSSVYRVMTHIRLLPWDVFNNLARVRHLQAPLLVIHGMEDSTVPIRQAEALSANAPHARLYRVSGAHHINLWDVAGDAFWDEFNKFVQAAK